MIGAAQMGILTYSTNDGFAGTDDRLDEFYRTELLKWLPATDDLYGLGSEFVSYVPLSHDIGVLSYGFSRPSRVVGRPNTVWTSIVSLSPRELSGYFDNPALLAYYCLSSGSFVFDGSSEFTLPESSIFEPVRWAAEFERRELGAVANAIDVHGRAVIIGDGNPLKFLAAIYDLIQSEIRWSTSFSYGIQMNENLGFKLQCCRELDQATDHFLIRNNIRHFMSPQREFAG